MAPIHGYFQTCCHYKPRGYQFMSLKKRCFVACNPCFIIRDSKPSTRIICLAMLEYAPFEDDDSQQVEQRSPCIYTTPIWPPTLFDVPILGSIARYIYTLVSEKPFVSWEQAYAERLHCVLFEFKMTEYRMSTMGEPQSLTIVFQQGVFLEA